MTAPNPPAPVYWRKSHLLGDAARGIPALLPISERTLWRLVKQGKFPAPLRLTRRIVLWEAQAVQQWLDDYHADRR